MSEHRARIALVQASAVHPSVQHGHRSIWERLVAPATVFGFLVGGAGLLLAGFQLEAANHQARQVADATELQAFASLRHEIYDTPDLKAFNRAADHLRTVVRGPESRFPIPTADGLAIVFVTGEYEQLARLFLADRSALPHARQLFGEPMACALLDYELIRTKSTNFQVKPLDSLPKFTRTSRCRSTLSVNGVAIGYV